MDRGSPSRSLGAVAVLLLYSAGVVLVIDAVRRGEATFGLLVIFPVVFGTSAELGFGILALVAGTFLGFLLVAGGRVPAPGPAPSAGAPDEVDAEGAGLLLIGPVPIFLGAWRRPPARRYFWVAVGAAVLFALAVALAFFVRPGA